MKRKKRSGSLGPIFVCVHLPIGIMAGMLRVVVMGYS